MHVTNPVALHKSAEVIQLNFFDDAGDVAVVPPKHSKATPPGPAPLHDAPAPAKATKPVKPAKAAKAPKAVKPGLDTRPKQTVTAPAKAMPPADELLVDPDEPESVDLEYISSSDTPESILCKRMFLRMMWDIEGKPDDVEPDLFGQVSVSNACQTDQNRLDALIWLYDLNPDGSLVSIGWVCEVLEFDLDRVRRIVGRNVRKELKRVVHLLSTIVSMQHARACEEKISDYLDISNWNPN